jgi:hypothetical protein
MNIFKGKEELEEMNKSDVISMMKDITNPNRFRGGIITSSETNIVTRTTGRGEIYDYELTSTYARERRGYDMTYFKPTIDGTEYTWGNLKTYPAPLLKVLAYRLWQQNNGSEEE